MLDTPPLDQQHLAEHLSPACDSAVALRHTVSGGREPDQGADQLHLSWTDFSEVSITEPPVGGLGGPRPMQNHSLAVRDKRYSGGVQIPLPEHLLMGPDDRPAREAQDMGAAAADPQRDAHRHMMAIGVNTLRHICPEMKEIGEHLSINNAWEFLAGLLGLCYKEVAVYRGIIQYQPGAPPGQTFLETYMNGHDLTLGTFLQTLLSMTPTAYHQLARRLWTAALLNNSPYYLNLRYNRSI